MDLRVQASLFAALLSLALAGSVLLRSRKRRLHWTFGIFGLAVSLWYSSSFLLDVFEDPVWARAHFAGGVALPISAMQFFLAFAAHDTRRMTLLSRTGILSALVLTSFAITPYYQHRIVLALTMLHGLVFMSASLWLLLGRARAATSRFERARLHYLILFGALASGFTLLEYLPLVGLEIPPVGTILVILFLYVLSQSIVRYRLLDLYELAARLGVLTSLALSLAGFVWLLLSFAGERFFLHAFVASLVVLLLFEPLRMKLGDVISQFFFRERYVFERSVAELRRRLAHSFEIHHLVPLVLDGLERSGRITDASVYLLDPDQRAYSLAGQVGRVPPRRLELAPSRPLLERLQRDGAIVTDNLRRELDERRELGEDREAETIFEVIQTMEALYAGTALAIASGQGDLYGLLCVGDERIRDAFSPEEVQVLAGLAAQSAIAIENSQLYQTMKERDRLAALGEMAAGLAHEIRNPLGAIKASAQYLGELGSLGARPRTDGAGTASPTPARGGAEAGGSNTASAGPNDADAVNAPVQRYEGSNDGNEFLDIIVEEVDRLNRVVESFLHYARPGRGDPALTRVEPAIERTLQLLAREAAAASVVLHTRFEKRAPSTESACVRIDPERLRQVLINLVQNAIQAMPNGGEIWVETEYREFGDVQGVRRRWVEIHVTDTGHGISPELQETLFLPFVTTRDRGTGLGLAISLRIVTDAGGRILVRSTPGRGSRFVIRLPEASEFEEAVAEQEVAAEPMAPAAASRAITDSAMGQRSADAPHAHPVEAEVRSTETPLG